MDLKLIESIGSQNIERLVQFRVKPDVDLLKAIEEAVKAEGVRAGVIVSGLGALKKALFRNLKVFPKSYPVTPEDRLYLEVTTPMELVSLSGWIAPKTGSSVPKYVEGLCIFILIRIDAFFPKYKDGDDDFNPTDGPFS